MELLTVVVIVAILAILLVPGIGMYRDRARRLGCAENLKGLFSASTSYLNANAGVWPQIKWNPEDERIYVREWHEALNPYGIGWVNFICPSVQAKIGNPDFTVPKNNRTDYLGAFFDNNSWTATRWDKQPWFTERQDMHGGNLMVLADGSLIDIHEARRRSFEPKPKP